MTVAEDALGEFNDPSLPDEIYRGVVVDREDPEQDRRLKVRIPGPINDGIADRHLPWAKPSTSDDVGSLPDVDAGTGGVPSIGATVKVDFIGGDPMDPVWGRPMQQKNSVPKRMLGEKDEAYETMESNLDGEVGERSPELGKYPDVRGTVYESGIVTEVDETDGQRRILRFHPNGYREEIFEDGVRVLHVEGESQRVVKGEAKRKFGSDYTRVVEGDVDDTVKGDVKRERQGSVEETNQGSVTITNQSSVEETTQGSVTKTTQGSVTKTTQGSVTESVSSSASFQVGGTVNYQTGGVFGVQASLVRLSAPLVIG